MTDQELMKSIVIYTDGACSGNPGPGGWGAIVVYPNGQVQELGAAKNPTTNNEMELMAIFKALTHIQDEKLDVCIFTDSVYAIRGATQWVWGWRQRGWTNAAGEEVKNKELWQRLMPVLGDRKKLGRIEWRFSRGHSGIAGNERCDEIAVAFSQGRRISLYSGSVLQYSVAVHDFPPEEPLPEMKAPTEKKVAFSYLSLHGGEVYRHQDWASCERRVKGKSGAKFKKAMSAGDEQKILADWGLSPSTSIKS